MNNITINNINTTEINEQIITTEGLVIPKKRNTVKFKPVNTKLEQATIDKLDRLCVEKGYNRTEFIRYLIEYCLENLIKETD